MLNKISVYDAFKAYTVDVAYSSSEEHLFGSIKEKMYGDLVVLSENLLEISTEKLKDLEVETTIMNGNIIYSKYIFTFDIIKGVEFNIWQKRSWKIK